MAKRRLGYVLWYQHQDFDGSMICDLALVPDHDERLLCSMFTDKRRAKKSLRQYLKDHPRNHCEILQIVELDGGG